MRSQVHPCMLYVWTWIGGRLRVRATAILIAALLQTIWHMSSTHQERPANPRVLWFAMVGLPTI